MNWLKSRVKSFGHAFHGLKLGYRELHMKIHLAAAVLVTMLGLVFTVTYVEWLILILCFAIVIGAELFNTALETLSDRVTREQDPLIGQAKDLAAAGVLVTSISAAIIGVMILLHHII